MTALLLPSETLQVGVNVIVRQGDAEGLMERWYYAPNDWVALTGPCPTCGGVKPDGIFNEHWNCVGLGATPFGPYCRDGRWIVPLYTDRPNIIGWNDLTAIVDGTERVLAGRGSIEVVPVVDGPPTTWPHDHVLWIANSTIGDSLLMRYKPVADREWSMEAKVSLDPLPVPGRDWGIVIDCVEVMT